MVEVCFWPFHAVLYTAIITYTLFLLENWLQFLILMPFLVCFTQCGYEAICFHYLTTNVKNSLQMRQSS